MLVALEELEHERNFRGKTIIQHIVMPILDLEF
jgi:hypothetical protein